MSWNQLSPEEQRAVLKVTMQGTSNNPANETRARAALSGNADFLNTMMARAGIGTNDSDIPREDAGAFARAEGVRRNMQRSGGGVPDGGREVTQNRPASAPSRSSSQRPAAQSRGAAAPDEGTAAASRDAAQPSDEEIAANMDRAVSGNSQSMANAPVPQSRPNAESIAAQVSQDPSLVNQILQILLPGAGAAAAARYGAQRMQEFSQSGAGAMGRAGPVDYGGGDPVENMNPQRGLPPPEQRAMIEQERRLALPPPGPDNRPQLPGPDGPPQVGGPSRGMIAQEQRRALPPPTGGQGDAMAYLDMLMRGRADDDGMGQASRSAPQQAEDAREAVRRSVTRRPKLSAPNVIRR